MPYGETMTKLQLNREILKSSVVDIQSNENFTKHVPANARALALVISEKMLSFQSDGNKMCAVY